MSIIPKDSIVLFPVVASVIRLIAVFLTFFLKFPKSGIKRIKIRVEIYNILVYDLW